MGVTSSAACPFPKGSTSSKLSATGRERLDRSGIRPGPSWQSPSCEFPRISVFILRGLPAGRPRPAARCKALCWLAWAAGLTGPEPVATWPPWDPSKTGRLAGLKGSSVSPHPSTSHSNPQARPGQSLPAKIWTGGQGGPKGARAGVLQQVHSMCFLWTGSPQQLLEGPLFSPKPASAVVKGQVRPQG